MRTDLAEEANTICFGSAKGTSSLPGVRVREWTESGLRRCRLEILNGEGAEALGKPPGIYETLQLPGPYENTDQAEGILGNMIRSLLHLAPEDSVLVVGLGNRAMTPDNLGPMTADRIPVTAHMHRHFPKLFRSLRPVTALVPGVLGNTGMESAEVVQSVAASSGPAGVIVVDALAAGSGDRLCSVVQVTDAGIVPGSGVGNARKAISTRTLGIPVVAVGVPTVMDAGTKARPLMVTPRDVDAQILRLSGILSHGISRALFPDWQNDEIAQFCMFPV